MINYKKVNNLSFYGKNLEVMYIFKGIQLVSDGFSVLIFFKILKYLVIKGSREGILCYLLNFSFQEKDF